MLFFAHKDAILLRMYALDVAAGVFVGGLPIVLIFMSMLKRTQNDMFRAWAYGIFAALIGLFLIAGIGDDTIWRVP
jgi:hypothetical protein